MKAKSNKDIRRAAYHKYMASSYYLNQLGYVRDDKSPDEYAQITDNLFGSNFTIFNRAYQKVKYSTLSLTAQEEATVQGFYMPFIKAVKSGTPVKTRISKFLNIYNTIHFFTQPKIS